MINKDFLLGYGAGKAAGGGGGGGGGGSVYTLLKSVEADINFSSTTQALAATVSNVQGFETAQIIYVCIRDKAGKRKNHFYGSDNWIPNLNADAGSGSSIISAQKYRVTSTPIMEASASAYGVWVYSIDTSGNVEIYARYSNTGSLTINGTFQIDVYAMSWPDGKNIFE